MPLHRDVPPPLLAVARAAAGATVEDAAGQAGAAAEDHGDVRDGD